VFGVGFFRELFTKHSKRRRAMVSPRHSDPGEEARRLGPEELRHRKLVRRSHLITIVAAWVITVPAAALLAAAVFTVLDLIR
jgi:PiT family inorganic phosphate transporter